MSRSESIVAPWPSRAAPGMRAMGEVSSGTDDPGAMARAEPIRRLHCAV